MFQADLKYAQKDPCKDSAPSSETWGWPSCSAHIINHNAVTFRVHATPLSVMHNGNWNDSLLEGLLLHSAV